MAWLPQKQGLYDPEFERDACGVGFVANIKGAKSHAIVEQGLEVLVNLAHRGACGCDPETGDGAGILIQTPDAFLRKHMPGLPPPGKYGAGMVFLPRNSVERRICEAVIEKSVADEDLRFLGWRDVPVDNSRIGQKSREVEPVIRQFFVQASSDEPQASRANSMVLPRQCASAGDVAPQASIANGPAHGTTQNAPGSTDAFERKLFVARKVIESAVSRKGLSEASYFCVCSFSSRTLVYKGLLMAHQIGDFYLDLKDPDLVTAIALVHQRFSTNTFPTWDLAHPYRYIAHNGEINTIRGNRNWMRAREARLASPLFGADVEKIKPLVNMTGSDSQTLDNALELLIMGGRSLPHALMILVPEAWQGDEYMDPDKRAFYEYHACLMEPWDGPAAIAATDGTRVGAILDRNGLRPARYLVTRDDLVVMASEAGVLSRIPPADVVKKGRLQPGKIFLVDTQEGRIIDDEELKDRIVHQAPYREWVEKYKIDIRDLPDPTGVHAPNHETILERQQVFGYTLEDLKFILAPQAAGGEQPLGSMGNDTPLAVLSERPQMLYNYFKQLFAQVTNPPIDPIREELVMSTIHYIGPNGNLMTEEPAHCHQIKLDSFLLTNAELEKLRQVAATDFQSRTLQMLFDPHEGAEGMKIALDRLCREASRAVDQKIGVLILSDRGVDREHAPIPALLAVSAVHHHLIREGSRTYVALVLESGEPREVHHFALLVGYGASAINPYLAFESISDMIRLGELPDDLDADHAYKNFWKAISKGFLKTIAKMGISTLQSYRGAQIFEAVGLNCELIDQYFTGTACHVPGIGLNVIAEEAIARHRFAYPPVDIAENLTLDPGGHYQWRRGGELHQLNPDTVASLQHAVKKGSYRDYAEFSRMVNDQNERLCTLRGLLRFKPGAPIPIEEVEPATEIVKRFATGAMSLGSISREAHETLAIAMNRLGGRSNTGEGGEDPVRYQRDTNGDNRRSSIKQVASGRFGVTAHYLVNADELQIKMAQGAKPGEGGELPGHKVDRYIAQVRHTTPGVTLVSPPPHHDIYSIEDLAQLIFDLKNVNPGARISVKLVSNVDVGIVAAGVAKAHADVVLISGYEGGTGASPLSSIKHAGIPWELGLAQTQQVLVMNDLRGRIRVQTDGQLKTGRDVVIAGMLGAEEFGFSSAPLVALGCIMMRVCHLGTCPVGIATQDPVLRQRFEGQAEHVIRYFFFVAEEVRQIMAEQGIRRFDDLVGRVDLLDVNPAIDHWKARGLDISLLLFRPDVPESIAVRQVAAQDHGLDEALDYHLINACQAALNDGAGVEFEGPIYNSNRTVGTMLSGEVAKRYGEAGLPEETIRIKLHGSAGQSFGAFLAPGITLTLEGDANDYLGKGLSGGRIVAYPPLESPLVAHENIIAGNTLLYGATSGQVFLRGVVGERFAVRNSGAEAVVEGAGDHCCEYMTGGVVVALGKTGRNFAAGMSGGVAYVFDEDSRFFTRVNRGGGSILLKKVEDEEEARLLLGLVEAHYTHTGSQRARELLQNWPASLGCFVKVVSREYERLLADQSADSGVTKERVPV